MTTPVISVENLGKRYRIGLAQERAKNLREALTRLPLAPFRYLRSRLRGATEEETLWALRNVSFEVQQGEVLGIIGRNGAGKSTLLKILSRITDPTEGRAVIRGRVNSLLEVGTGFHPELTGRENIYMNAAMHGMKRAEITRKLDEIVAFAEVERFIDTPVKRYSSGMYTRLAFAVAAHLEPDILIVDEVLAVGDAQFQEKCLGKMRGVARQGRAVLFVSHNMVAVNELCSRAMLFECGKIAMSGLTNEVVAAYLASGAGYDQDGILFDRVRAEGSGEALIRLAQVVDQRNNPKSELYFGESFTVRLLVRVLQPLSGALIYVLVTNPERMECLTYTSNMDADGRGCDMASGDYEIRVHQRTAMLPGRYTLSVGVVQKHVGGVGVDNVPSAYTFKVLNISDGSRENFPWDRGWGYVRADADWSEPVVMQRLGDV